MVSFRVGEKYFHPSFFPPFCTLLSSSFYRHVSVPSDRLQLLTLSKRLALARSEQRLHFLFNIPVERIRPKGSIFSFFFRYLPGFLLQWKDDLFRHPGVSLLPVLNKNRINKSKDRDRKRKSHLNNWIESFQCIPQLTLYYISHAVNQLTQGCFEVYYSIWLSTIHAIVSAIHCFALF